LFETSREFNVPYPKITVITPRTGSPLRPTAAPVAALPKITVVTPCLNHAGFLETAILGQCYPRLEYIIIDGGSTDGSQEIIRRYERSLAYWTSMHGGSRADAINKGFGRATGEIFCWLNSDDFYLPGTLQRIAEALGPKVGAPALVFGGALCFQENGSRAEVARSREHDPEFLRVRDYISQPSSFWTEALWRQCGPMDAALSFAFEWDWLLRAAKLAEFVRLEPILSARRLHEDRESVSKNPGRRAELLEVARRHGRPEIAHAYEFLNNHWHAAQKWARFTETLRCFRAPFAPELARCHS
jgi:glycosyltransferase involved in cell wall biosynthesis